MTKALARPMIATLLLLTACGSSTDPSNVDLNGTWRATVNVLGIGPMSLTLVELNNELTATGEWTPLEGGAPLSVTAQGLRFGVDLNLALRFSTATSTANYTTQGRIEDESSFHLVFPAEDNPTRVVFRRQ